MQETYRAIAHPWFCDINGHLNTRFYQGWFDDASWHLLGAAGFDVVKSKAAGLSFVDLTTTTEYLSEVLPGALVIIRSGFIRLGNKSFAIRHDLETLDGSVCARCELTGAFFDLNARRAIQMTDEFRRAAAPLIVVTAS